MMETTNLPMLDNQFKLHEWPFIEDQFHLPSLFDEAPILPPTITYSTDYFKPNNNLPTNYLLEYPNTLCTQNLENFSADFHLLSEDPWERLLHTIDHSNNSITLLNKSEDNHFSRTNYSFNDQTLDKIDLSMVQTHENFMERNIYGNVDYINNKIKRINGEYNSKVTKIESISYEEISKYFNNPISIAAKKLKVGLTILKKRCRELNIKRWPHRKIKSLEALISNLKEEKGMIEMVNFLEDYKRKLQFVPGLEMDKETKRLRQQFFKANYKKRRALALGHM